MNMKRRKKTPVFLKWVEVGLKVFQMGKVKFRDDCFFCLVSKKNAANHACYAKETGNIQQCRPVIFHNCCIFDCHRAFENILFVQNDRAKMKNTPEKSDKVLFYKLWLFRIQTFLDFFKQLLMIN